MKTDLDLLRAYLRVKQQLQHVQEHSVRREHYLRVVQNMQDRIDLLETSLKGMEQLREQNRVLRHRLIAALQDLSKAETAEQELEEYLDEEIHPNYPYDLYTYLMDSIRDIVDWEHSAEWRT